MPAVQIILGKLNWIQLILCSHFTVPVNQKVRENDDFSLRFPEPAPALRRYREIGWLKLTIESSSKIVFYHEDFTDNLSMYFDEYCEGFKTCNYSKKVKLNTKTGDLTIHKVTLEDEGKYHYWFVVDDEVPDTGVRYEIELEVYGKHVTNKHAERKKPSIACPHLAFTVSKM